MVGRRTPTSDIMGQHHRGQKGQGGRILPLWTRMTNPGWKVRRYGRLYREDSWKVGEVQRDDTLVLTRTTDSNSQAKNPSTDDP